MKVGFSVQLHLLLSRLGSQCVKKEKNFRKAFDFISQDYLRYGYLQELLFINFPKYTVSQRLTVLSSIGKERS
jgi:hypothetical protein